MVVFSSTTAALEEEGGTKGTASAMPVADEGENPDVKQQEEEEAKSPALVGDGELSEKLEEEDKDQEEGQVGTEKEKEEVQDKEEEEDDMAISASSSTTEGQGAEINDKTTKKTWEGFDEDFTSPSIEDEEMHSIHSHDISELKGVQDYEVDGFRFHVLHPKKDKGNVQLHSIRSAAAVLLAAFALCFCCLRCRRGRGHHNALHGSRGKYAALGSDDFFNGTFSDDISYRGKDSDEEEDDDSMKSFDSDEEGGGIKLELGGMQELDANGGLTLDECNG